MGIRIIAPIPGKGTIGIEFPNVNPQIVSMKTMLTSPQFVDTKYELPIAIGKTISSAPYVADLANMQHLLMAGATGQVYISPPIGTRYSPTALELLIS